MMKTAKIFDCVKMKEEIQKKLREEYEQNKDSYSSYFEFIKTTADRDSLVQSFRKKITR